LDSITQAAVEVIALLGRYAACVSNCLQVTNIRCVTLEKNKDITYTEMKVCYLA